MISLVQPAELPVRNIGAKLAALRAALLKKYRSIWRGKSQRNHETTMQMRIKNWAKVNRELRQRSILRNKFEAFFCSKTKRSHISPHREPTAKW